MTTKGHVYVIDDDEAMRDSLNFLLDSSGFGVTLFENAQSFLDALPGLHLVDGLAIHPGRARPRVAPHPIPGHQQEAGITDDVVQIIEPAMRIAGCPAVQLGLDLPYPSLSPIQLTLQFVGVHRRPPGIPSSLLPTCWPRRVGRRRGIRVCEPFSGDPPPNRACDLSPHPALQCSIPRVLPCR